MREYCFLSVSIHVYLMKATLAHVYGEAADPDSLVVEGGDEE